MHTQGPALARRDALTAIGVSVVSAIALGSPLAMLEALRGSTSNRGAANAASQEKASFVLSF